jgi:hypothetical protein
MCAGLEVPVWRALCRHCYPVVPWDLRIEFMRAYRRRIFDPVVWQETKIRGRQWYLQSGMGAER